MHNSNSNKVDNNKVDKLSARMLTICEHFHNL